jgi:5-deoxy-glucuronate isomerase
MSTAPLETSKLIFSGTASRRGRHISVTPANSVMAHLHYGRVILAPDEPRVAFATEGRETALLSMRGACSITVDGTRTDIGLHDAIYIPRGSAVVVETTGEVDLVECAAEVSGTYPLQVIRYAELSANPKLKFRAGGEATTRDLNIVVGDNVKAGRILMGFTRSQHGNWTSWPPHEHTKMLEEVYVYFDMPPPAFGIQLVYDTPERPEFAAVVHDGDAVLMPSGYHPNVAAPGHSINFIWMMAAHKEVEDRQFGVVNVQPGFGSDSGIGASSRK